MRALAKLELQLELEGLCKATTITMSNAVATVMYFYGLIFWLEQEVRLKPYHADPSLAC